MVALDILLTGLLLWTKEGYAKSLKKNMYSIMKCNSHYDMMDDRMNSDEITTDTICLNL